MASEKIEVPPTTAPTTVVTERTTTTTTIPATTSTNRHATRGHENTSENLDADCLLIIKIILAIIFPPLAVALETGCGCQLLLNILLTIVGWFPGVIHALFVIFHCGDIDREVDEERAAEGGATTTGARTAEPVYPPPLQTTTVSEPVTVKKV